MYSMQDASSYDWSVGQPPDVITSSSVLWSLPLTNGTYGSTILSSSAAGVNHSNQTRQTFFTFLAGVIFGVAGGALLGTLSRAAPHASRQQIGRNRGTGELAGGGQAALPASPRRGRYR